MNDDSRGGIWIMPASGGTPRQLTNDAAADDYYPQWFPDGRRLAVLRDVPGHDSDVWIVSLNGEEQRITKYAGFDGKPTISPDGMQIAFPSDRGGSRNIWIVRVGDSDERARKVTFDGGRGPAWSPDGRWIAYGCPVIGGRYAICLKSIGRPGAVQVTDGKSNDFNPEWGPDGTWIACGRETQNGRGVIAIVDVAAVVKAFRR